MAEAEHNYYMVRAMGQTEPEFDLFFKNSVVAVGWSRVNFSSFDNAEALVKEVKKEYYSDGKTNPQVVGRRLSQIRRFHGIKEGDRIIVPYHSFVRLAKAKSKRRYDAGIVRDRDLSNQLEVEYLRDGENNLITVRRAKLTEGLQRRLRVPGSTISDLAEYKDEVNRLFGAKTDTWASWINKEEEQRDSEFKIQLLTNLQKGKTNLKAGGIGLEHLVRELLEIEGYKAEFAHKKAFSSFADADIRATRADHIEEIKLLVQVKHHRGTSGTWGAEQLVEIRRQQIEDFSDYKLVLVTSGEPNKNLEKVCDDQDIVLIDGTKLVQWIADSVTKLRIETKMKLGISDVPRLLVESH